MASPTARTLEKLRKAGHEAGVVERFNHHTKLRHDLFGCIDLVALVEGRIVGIQATSGSNVAARATKSSAEPRLITWLKSCGVFLVVGWSKRGAAGKRKLWTPRVVQLDLDDGELRQRELEPIDDAWPFVKF